MKVYYVILGVIFTALCISACSNFVHVVKREKHSGETVNINIETNSENDCVKITIDSVEVDIKALKSHVKKKRDEEAQKKIAPLMYGTF